MSKNKNDNTDYDIIIEEKSSLHDLAGAAVSKLQWKLFGFMFIVFMFVNSDVFISRILSKIDGATDFKDVTSYGTGLQALLLVLACIIFDVLIKYKIV